MLVKSDGSIYLLIQTRSHRIGTGFLWSISVSADLGDIHVLVWDFVVPNGLAFSPDERILYVNDSRRGHIRAFDVEPTGLLALVIASLPPCRTTAHQCPRRHESRCGGQRLLHGSWRHLDFDPRDAYGDDSDRRADDECGLGRC